MAVIYLNRYEMSQETFVAAIRSKLYKEVWTERISEVALRYGVSAQYLAKICRKLRIPLPGRGHWLRVSSGEAVDRPPLQKLDERMLSPNLLATFIPEQIARRHAAKVEAAKEMAVMEQAKPIAVATKLLAPHPLVRAAAARLRQRDGWSDKKGLRAAPYEVLDLSVTPSSLDRALCLMDALLKDLARQSVSVTIDPSKQQTFVDVNGMRLQLALSEHVKRTPHRATPAKTRSRITRQEALRAGRFPGYESIPQFDYHPTGVLTITVSRRPSRAWKDTPSRPLETRLREVILGILALAAELQAEKDLQVCRVAADREERERVRTQSEHSADECNALRQLAREAMNWERARQLRAYVDAVVGLARSNGSLTAEQKTWADWARAKADSIDPLTNLGDREIGIR